MEPKDRLIVALDVDSEDKALSLVRQLKKDINLFKIGMELFSACGPEIVGLIRENSCNVFLDLKLHDIPNTVARAATLATRLGVFMFNVHAMGGHDMMKRTAEAARSESEKLKIAKPRILAVTVLTSMDENGLKKIGINDNMNLQVLRLARMAQKAGLDGVVASPSEARLIRDDIGPGFLIVTPGVRPSWSAAGDQKRLATPKEAIANGANFIVVGRPIIEAPDPKEAARKILEEIGI